MPSRRTVLRSITIATAAVASPRVTAASAAQDAHAPPLWLLGPLQENSELGGEWRLGEIGPISQGASVVELIHPTQGVLRIHLCLHEGNPKGYAYTDLFDLIVIDHGRGIRQVPEDLAPALTKLKNTIQDNELLNNSAFAHIADMMTHKERVAAFGARQIQ